MTASPRHNLRTERAAQGLPAKVADRHVLAKVAVLLARQGAGGGAV